MSCRTANAHLNVQAKRAAQHWIALHEGQHGAAQPECHLAIEVMLWHQSERDAALGDTLLSCLEKKKSNLSGMHRWTLPGFE